MDRASHLEFYPAVDFNLDCNLVFNLAFSLALRPVWFLVASIQAIMVRHQVGFCALEEQQWPRVVLSCQTMEEDTANLPISKSNAKMFGNNVIKYFKCI